MYKVIKFFTDLQDNNHAYNVGDEFPRAGMKVSDARFAELSGSKNRQGTPLIKFENEEKKSFEPKIEKPEIKEPEIKEEAKESVSPKKTKRPGKKNEE